MNEVLMFAVVYCCAGDYCISSSGEGGGGVHWYQLIPPFGLAVYTRYADDHDMLKSLMPACQVDIESRAAPHLNLMGVALLQFCALFTRIFEILTPYVKKLDLPLYWHQLLSLILSSTISLLIIPLTGDMF